MFFSPQTVHRASINGYGYAPIAVPVTAALDPFFHSALDASHRHDQIESDDTSVTISIDVPGLSKEQLTIGIEGRILRIAATDDAPRSFKATYKLSSEVNPAQSQAKLEHGVLTIKLTKVAPQSRQTLLTID